MADPPPLRTGRLSVLLPASTPEHRIRSMVRQVVVDGLAATGEWPTRVKIVSSQPTGASVKRWFVEYETGSHGEVLDPRDLFD
jgi:hypothetical protein